MSCFVQFAETVVKFHTQGFLHSNWTSLSMICYSYSQTSSWWTVALCDCKPLCCSAVCAHGGGRGHWHINNVMAKLLQWNVRGLQA